MEAKDPKQASFEVSHLLLFSLHPPLGYSGNDAEGSFQFLFQIFGTLDISSQYAAGMQWTEGLWSFPS